MFGHTRDTLLSGETKTAGKTQTCAFCEKRYWTDECRSFPEMESRKYQLKGRCFICLRTPLKSARLKIHAFIAAKSRITTAACVRRNL